LAFTVNFSSEFLKFFIDNYQMDERFLLKATQRQASMDLAEKSNTFPLNLNWDTCIGS